MQACTQWTPLDDLVLVAGRDCNVGSHVTVLVFVGIPPPGHCRDSKLKYTPNFCERGLIFSPGSSALRTGFRLGTHLETYREALREYRPGVPFLCSPSGQCPCYAQAGEVIHSLTHYRQRLLSLPDQKAYLGKLSVA